MGAAKKEAAGPTDETGSDRPWGHKGRQALPTTSPAPDALGSAVDCNDEVGPAAAPSSAGVFCAGAPASAEESPASPPQKCLSCSRASEGMLSRAKGSSSSAASSSFCYTSPGHSMRRAADGRNGPDKRCRTGAR